jgi:hypothetical protein
MITIRLFCISRQTRAGNVIQSKYHACRRMFMKQSVVKGIGYLLLMESPLLESTIELGVVCSVCSHSPATTTVATRRSTGATAATPEDVDDDNEVNDCD